MELKDSNTISSAQPGRQVLILNSALENGAIHKLLLERNICRVRVADRTLKNSVIFPVKSMAFLLMAISETSSQWPPTPDLLLNEEIVQRLEKFCSIHRNCHLFLLAKMTTENEYRVFTALQQRFWKSSLVIHPASSAQQFVNILQQVITPSATNGSNEYNNLMKGNLPEEMALNVLEKNLAISPHQSLVLLDGCQTISNIGCSSFEDLMEKSPLPSEVVKKVQQFFERDCVSI